MMESDTGRQSNIKSDSIKYPETQAFTMWKHGGKIFNGWWISKYGIQSVAVGSLDVACKTSHLHILPFASN